MHWVTYTKDMEVLVYVLFELWLVGPDALNTDHICLCAEANVGD